MDEETKNVYSLPLERKDIVLTLSNKRVHSGHLNNAIDFIVPKGTKIFAARNGEVIAVKDNSKLGGLNKKYIGNKYLNYISIQHNNGEISEYAHIKYHGSFVKKGQKVKKGQLIGLSGNTGYSSEPHLHFHVARLDDSSNGWKTLQIKFSAKVKIRRNYFNILSGYLVSKIAKVTK